MGFTNILLKVALTLMPNAQEREMLALVLKAKETVNFQPGGSYSSFSPSLYQSWEVSHTCAASRRKRTMSMTISIEWSTNEDNPSRKSH